MVDVVEPGSTKHYTNHVQRGPEDAIGLETLRVLCTRDNTQTMIFRGMNAEDTPIRRLSDGESFTVADFRYGKAEDKVGRLVITHTRDA